MHRRGHKKSRNGCLECKRRHMKCDESRPQCANCTTVHRKCQYLETPSAVRVPYLATDPPASIGASPAYTNTTIPTTEPPTPARRSTDEGITPGVSPSSAPLRQHTTPQTSAPQTPRLTSTSVSGSTSAGADTDHDDEAVNILHAELAFHFSVNLTSPELDTSFVDMGNRIVIEEAVKAPYLLYECLAVSARHLSILRPEKQDYYLRHSVQLQTKAIAMFNALESVDQSNCVASLLFSSVLNRHALADVLSNRDGNFGNFIDRFVQSVLLQKGVRTVSKAAWPQLLESNLRPIVKWATPDRNTVTTGHHCDELRQLISLTPALQPVDKEACRTAIHFLQLAFDSFTNPMPGKSAHQIVYIWGIFLPDEFCELLKAHRLEAVAVMAWYAVLLHESRDNWQVGDAGVVILNSIADFLGPEWAHWLEWPFSAIRNGL